MKRFLVGIMIGAVVGAGGVGAATTLTLDDIMGAILSRPRCPSVYAITDAISLSGICDRDDVIERDCDCGDCATELEVERIVMTWCD